MHRRRKTNGPDKGNEGKHDGGNESDEDGGEDRSEGAGVIKRQKKEQIIKPVVFKESTATTRSLRPRSRVRDDENTARAKAVTTSTVPETYLMNNQEAKEPVPIEIEQDEIADTVVESSSEAARQMAQAQKDLAVAKKKEEKAEQQLDEAMRRLDTATTQDDIALYRQLILGLRADLTVLRQRIFAPKQNPTLDAKLEQMQQQLQDEIKRTAETQRQQMLDEIKRFQKTVTSTTFKPSYEQFLADADINVHTNPNEIFQSLRSWGLEYEGFDIIQKLFAKVKPLLGLANQGKPKAKENQLQDAVMKFLNDFYLSIDEKAGSSNSYRSTVARNTSKANCGLRDIWGSLIFPDIVLTPKSVEMNQSISCFHEKFIIELKRPGENLVEENEAQLCMQLQAALYYNTLRTSIWGMLTNGNEMIFIKAIQPTNLHGIAQTQQHAASIRYEVHHSYSLAEPSGRKCLFAFLTATDEFYCMSPLVAVRSRKLGECDVTANLGAGVSGLVHQITTKSKKTYAIKYYTVPDDFQAEKRNLDIIAEGIAAKPQFNESIKNIVQIIDIIEGEKDPAIIMSPVGYTVRDVEANKLDDHTVTQLINLVFNVHEATKLVNYDIRDSNIVFTKLSDDSPLDLVSVDWVYAFKAGSTFQPCGCTRYAGPDMLKAFKSNQPIKAHIKHAYQAIVRVFYDCVSRTRHVFRNDPKTRKTAYIDEIEKHWSLCLSRHLWRDAEQAAVACDKDLLIKILSQCYDAQVNREPVKLKPGVN